MRPALRQGDNNDAELERFLENGKHIQRIGMLLKKLHSRLVEYSKKGRTTFTPSSFTSPPACTSCGRRSASRGADRLEG